MLILPIKRKWFQMIVAGEKKEEYRMIKQYYTSRFRRVFEFDPATGRPIGSDVHELILRNGYSSASPAVKVRCSLHIQEGAPEWGAEQGIIYYTLKIHGIEQE